MAIPVSIDRLLNNQVVESNRIEFKEGLQPTPLVHSICAFANDIDNIGGGYIVIGVEEKDGAPVFPVKGIERNQIDSLLKEIRRITHFIRPLYDPVVEPVQYQGKYLILIWVPGGPGRPYQAPETAAISEKGNKKDKPHKYVYIRKYSSSVQANDDELKELYDLSTTIPFDDRANYHADLSDLDQELFVEFLRKSQSSMASDAEQMSVEELAEAFRLLSGPSEQRKPVNAAVLFFCSNPQRFFPYARIELAYIPDPTGTGMEEKAFIGPLHHQLSEALEYIQRNYLKSKLFKPADQAESILYWNYPFQAVEELLASAVYHRDYTSPNPITVRITETELSITSFPGFHRSITAQNIQDKKFLAMFYRNRRLGDLLKDLRLIEGRNTGFPNAQKALEANGSGDLRIEMDENREYLTVTIPLQPLFAKPEKLYTDYQMKILNHLREKPSTLTELALAMQYKGITAKLKRNVEILKQDRVIVAILTKDEKIRLAVSDRFAF